MKVKFLNRSVVLSRVRNKKEIVDYMRKYDNESTKNNAEFMKLYAERKKLFDKLDIRFDDEEVFVGDLIKCRLIEIS